MFTILHRMIFLELFRVFFLCWIGLTGMILLGGVIAEATQQGLSPMQIIEIIPYLIPSTMPYTLPTTTLFATCVVYGRLSHDNEILAIKAAGINLFQATLPAIVLGSLVSAGTMVLYWDVIPSTHWELRTHFVNNLEEYLYSFLRKDGCLRHPGIEYTIFVKRVEGRKLIDAQFFHRDKKTGLFDFVARGREAELSVNQEEKIVNVKLIKAHVRKENDDNSYHEDFEWPISLDKLTDPQKTRPTDMPWPEMAKALEEYYATIDSMTEDRDRHLANVIANIASPEQVQHVKDRENQIRIMNGMVSNVMAEYQMRPALSLGCLCFVLVGCPIGIWFSRSDFLSSFITCFLPIVLIYYPLMLCGINFAKSGRMNAALAIWPANLVLAGAALFLMKKLKN